MLDDLWYKNAVFYCLNVGTFMDANGDGVGDPFNAHRITATWEALPGGRFAFSALPTAKHRPVEARGTSRAR
jgi:hypothetical protein